MIITLQDLKSSGACDEAVGAFTSAVGERTAEFEWTPAAQGLMLADPLWRTWFGWAVAAGLVPAWSMREAALSGTDLSGANLFGANLSGTDLSGANLFEANLSGADMSGVNLRWANLSGADMSGADLRWANLRGADMRGADLRWARYGESTVWPVGFDTTRTAA